MRARARSLLSVCLFPLLHINIDIDLDLGKTACGPDGFLYDVRNAVAESQLVIADGFGTCKDMFLHTETYRCVLFFIS